MDVFEAIKNRRSIRKYKSTPIPDTLIETILDAGRNAPSWKNSQCWRFIVVRDENIKNQLAETFAPGNGGFNAVNQAPAVIVACYETNVSGYKEKQAETDKGDWGMFDVALAMQNITLAATALGLGSVHQGLFNAAKATTILNVPPPYRIVEMMPLGYPESQPDPRPRKLLKDIVYHNRFGQF
jgi:nitroreductase